MERERGAASSVKSSVSKPLLQHAIGYVVLVHDPGVFCQSAESHVTVVSCDQPSNVP